VRSWLSQRPTVAAVAPAPRPAPQKSIMVARAAIARGQILKPADFTAQPWPDAAIHWRLCRRRNRAGCVARRRGRPRTHCRRRADH
jgi:Flp pilus assembly protein CpaB